MLGLPRAALADARAAVQLEPGLGRGWQRVGRAALLLGDTVTVTLAAQQLTGLGNTQVTQSSSHSCKLSLECLAV